MPYNFLKWKTKWWEYAHVHSHFGDDASSALRLFCNAVYLLKGTSISQSRKNSDRILTTLSNVFVSLFSKYMLEFKHAGPLFWELVADKTIREFIVLSTFLTKPKGLQIWFGFVFCEEESSVFYGSFTVDRMGFMEIPASAWKPKKIWEPYKTLK